MTSVLALAAGCSSSITRLQQPFFPEAEKNEVTGSLAPVPKVDLGSARVWTDNAAPLVSVTEAGFAWTRGAPKYFQSSNHVRRGFCDNCGTPLSYEGPDGVAIAIGALDAPERVRPVVQFGIEAKIAYVDHLHELPGRDTMDDVEAAPFLADMVSYQHPDRDTVDWTPKPAFEPDHWRPREQGV